ncbi:hypothetical protein B4U79_01644 [Dinothrombium tinctorium]|uniref:RRM domain-containing protein n=1 Tax=Dinothrombium tinctorium TaxID=1965070 RepID=A0A443R1Y8_9ACAR|nr:hypothetical protein B4U79_01644 [Dinothrombium tinctorium]
MNQSSGRSLSGPSAGGGSGGSLKKWGDTTSKKGEISRIFVGNTDPKITTVEDLENKFRAYGKIEGVDINPAGFSFVQFANVRDAQKAVSGENGTILKGRKIEVRMFDKSGPPKRKNPPYRERSRSPLRPASMAGQANPHQQYPPNYGGPNLLPPASGGPPLPPPPVPGNDIEIIYIDLLFLHSPQHITMTLNDLFERRTLYAVVVTPINEELKSLTLHILHSQTEHRNIPLEAAITLITKDFRNFMVRRGGGVPSPSPGDKAYDSLRPGVGDNSNVLRSGALANGSASATYSTSVAAAVSSTSGEKRLPDEIAYLLRTTLSEGGVQFLSLPQIDSIIEYFSRERDRLTSQARQQQLRTQTDQNYSQSYVSEQFQQNQSLGVSSLKQSGSAPDTASNLLDNPQVKAALNSLLQIGAIGNAAVGGQNANLNSITPSLVNSYSGSLKADNIQSANAATISSEAPSYLSTSASSNAGHAALQQLQSGAQQSLQNQTLRRHPLLGTEIGTTHSSINSYSGISGMSIHPSGPDSSHRGFASSSQRY